MLIKIYPQNPSEKAVRQVADILRGDGVVVYPTDGVYALGCSLHSPRALGRLRAITGKAERELSVVCPDLSLIATYARVDTPTFKMLKRNLPGPFTFILNASGKVPDKCLERRKTIGVRIPDNEIALAIVRELGCPLISASVKEPGEEGEEKEYTTDPSLIHERYERLVDAVVDGGYGSAVPTTVVDCTQGEPVIVREGAGQPVL